MPHVRSIIINAVNQDRVIDFWRALLHVGVLKIDEALGVTWLQPDADDGVTLGIQRVTSRSTSPPELHLDIAVDDPEATKSLVLEQGGSLISAHTMAGVGWYIMADPENNHFCIYCE
jgi:predicted enzyme related to lactoylglutathione lyase